MKKQSIKVNYILNTAYEILTLITPLITAPYISRVLGPDGVGVYSYTVSVVSFFIMFAVLGTTTYGQRAIARCRDDRRKLSKCFWEIEILSIVTTLISIIAWAIFIYISNEYRIYFAILSFELIAAIFDIIWFYRGIEYFKVIVIRNASIRILSIICLFVFVTRKEHVWIYILISALGKFFGNLSMWIPLRKYIDRVDIKELSIKPHVKETFAYFIPTAAASIYSYLDKIMIGAFTDTTFENGYYEQTQKIIKIAYTVLVSLNTVMSARMSYLFAKDKKDEIIDKLEKALAFIVVLGIPLVFGVSGIASNFVPWFFGDGYDAVVILLILSSPLIVIMSIHNFLSAQYLIPSGQRVRSTKGVITGAVINLLLNALLIPRYHAVGAVIATLVAETSICVVYFYMSKEYVPVSTLFKFMPKPLASAIVMTAWVCFIGIHQRGSILITIIQVVSGSVIYFGLLVILRDKFTIAILKKMAFRIIRRTGKKGTN